VENLYIRDWDEILGGNDGNREDPILIYMLDKNYTLEFIVAIT
jgi:hypothetical protein